MSKLLKQEATMILSKLKKKGLDAYVTEIEEKDEADLKKALDEKIFRKGYDKEEQEAISNELRRKFNISNGFVVNEDGSIVKDENGSPVLKETNS